MGSSISAIQACLYPKKEINVVMIGLDASGKTTLLYKITTGEVITTVPTIGFNLETVQYDDLKFNLWDIRGQHDKNYVWRQYYQLCSAIIYVVDASDQERISRASEELSTVLDSDDLKDIKVLVFANKQDLPNALSASQVADELGMHSRKHEWYVQGTSAHTGSGLNEGLDYLHKMLSNRT